MALTIGVLSDTHFTDPFEGAGFFRRLCESCFADASIILHAGDLVHPDALLGFGDCPVYAVRGNMDPSARELPLRRVVEIGPFRIGMIHGWGAPEGLEERVLAEFSDERLDALVYGHSHRPVCHLRKGLLLLNPGSPTDRRQAPTHTVGLLDVGETLTGRIVSLD